MNFGIAEHAIKRNFSGLLKKAKSIEADLFIAHNLSALPVAVLASKKHKSKCGFDAEDFHRHEETNDSNRPIVKASTYIEDKYLKHVDYLTAASPLIASAYQKLYPKLKPTVINNVFSIQDQPKIELNDNASIKLFWFSQTIGKNRGLEDAIAAINLLNNPLIELHLLGELSPENKSYFSALATSFEIHYYKPISSDQLFSFAAKFDIGLALEPGFSINNDIALSNKIFTYLISGLALIGSNTQAQQKFILENKSIGKTYQIGNHIELKNIILELFNNRTLLNEYKKSAYLLTKTKYNWEIESEKFIALIHKTLNN